MRKPKHGDIWINKMSNYGKMIMTCHGVGGTDLVVVTGYAMKPGFPHFTQPLMEFVNKHRFLAEEVFDEIPESRSNRASSLLGQSED